MSALAMGFIGGVLCFFSATTLKHAFDYDDSLDAFGVHGVGGTLGAILTGIFASASVNELIKTDTANYQGLLSGNVSQLLRQILAVIITWIFAALGSFVLLKIVDALVGLRVTESQEYDGLDLTQHGESGYNLEDAYSATFAGGGATLLHGGTSEAAATNVAAAPA
jgi:Amt family ammonium transporter